MANTKLYKRYRSPLDITFDSANILICLLIVVVTLYPFLNLLAVSLNDANDTIRGGIYLWPRIFTWKNYIYVFHQANILHSALISVLRTIIGTVSSVFLTAMLAYVVSRREFVLRRFVTIVFVLTMYLQPGIIPNYLLIRDLHLLNSFWVYIFPMLISAFNMILIRSFIDNLPDGLLESAKIDGAGDFTLFIRVVLPLTVPVLATIALFCGVWQWNNWFDVFLYNGFDQNLSTLQYELMKIMANTASSSSAASAFASAGKSANTVTPQSIRATMTIVASVPIMLVYPFLQKYFVHGMLIGGVKE